jgi:hypothetical protein
LAFTLLADREAAYGEDATSALGDDRRDDANAMTRVHDASEMTQVK